MSTTQARAIRSGPQPVPGASREAVARHVRDHHVESFGRGSTMRRRFVSGSMSLSCSTMETRPAVRDDDGQGTLMLRADVDEVNVETVDLGDEVRIGIQLRFHFPPVVLIAQ